MVDEEVNSFLKASGVLFVVLVATVFVYFRFISKPSGAKTLDWKDELSSTKASPAAARTTDAASGVNDVWGERRKRGLVASSSSAIQASSSSSTGDKPFGSSYYYAHNNPDTIGGYKDGLRMEDYTMNQPRLLSKGGVPVDSSSPDSSSATSSPPSSVAKRTDKVTPAVIVRRISKFQWDDPGNPDGIATIRIDTLPGSTLTETISWREANVSDVSAALINNKKGLLIELMAASERTRYRLQIPKLYGNVSEVRKVAKPNRLLVRLYKQKSWMNPFDKKNLEAWPYPAATE